MANNNDIETYSKLGEGISFHLSESFHYLIVIDPYKPKSDILDNYNCEYLTYGVTEIPYKDYLKMIPKELIK
jgi:hypothetical protein